MPRITDITWVSLQMQDRASVAETIATLCRVLAWAGLAVIAFVTVAPLEFRPTSGVSPQIERFAAFAAVGVLFSTAYSRHIWIAAAVVIGAAILLELLQLLEPSRHGRLFDAGIKTIGSIAGLTAGYIFARFISRRYD
jgi:glycopeptide antibiotics resistance protein